MDDTEGSPPTLNADIETEVKEMMGLFDLPAFARRGQDLEITLRRLHERCRNARGRVARHGSAAAPPVVARRHRARRPGPSVFTRSIEPLWPLARGRATDVGRTRLLPFAASGSSRAT